VRRLYLRSRGYPIPVSETADQFEERDEEGGEDELAAEQSGKGYGEDEGERDESLDEER